jgi:anti-sigma B factor antagonist
MDLTITSEPGPSGAVRLRVSGAVDLASRDELFDSGSRVLSEAAGLLLNLSEVRFMDSTGIGALIDLAREADDHGKTFAIEEPSQRVLRILTLTGLQDEWIVPAAAED